MPLSGDFKFRRKLEQSENIFADTVNIAATARKKADDCNNQIFHSQAVAWAVQGIEPKYKGTGYTRRDYEESQLQEEFCYIEDKEICTAVRKSFYASKKANNLVYRYGSIKDSQRQARVRVLTRMLWYRLLK